MAKSKTKLRDIVSYSTMNYNPFIPDNSVYDKINGISAEWDVSLVDHRKRIKKIQDAEKQRNLLAKDLGVNYEPKLTPIDEILKNLPK